MKKPKLQKIDLGHKSTSIWLENGAHIKYEVKDDSLRQYIFAPDDPHSAWEINDVGLAGDSVHEFALGWLEWYLESPASEIKKDDFHKHLLKEALS
mgnify:CR=1 FL=1